MSLPPPEVLRQSPLSEDDFRATVQLLGRIASMTSPLAERKRALMDGLCELVGVSRWIWTTSTNVERGGTPMAVAVMYGGFSERDFALIVEASQDAQTPVPENEPMIADIIEHGHVTRTRSDWMPDDAFYQHPQWKLYREPAGTDHYLFSLYPIAGGYLSGIGLHRAPGEPDFTARDRRLVHIVVSELGWLHTAEIPGEQPARKVRELSPRLRVVFILLVKGWNRKRIAEHLGITPNTTAGYIKDVYQHFGVSSQVELLSRFIEGNGGDVRP